MSPKEWKKITLLLEPTMVTQIDEWRRQQPDLPDRNEAIRRLIAQQLGPAPKEDTGEKE